MNAARSLDDPFTPLTNDSQTATDIWALEWLRADWRARSQQIDHRCADVASLLRHDPRRQLVNEHLRVLHASLYAVLEDRQPIERVDDAINALKAITADSGLNAPVLHSMLDRLRRCVDAVRTLLAPHVDG